MAGSNQMIAMESRLRCRDSKRLVLGVRCGHAFRKYCLSVLRSSFGGSSRTHVLASSNVLHCHSGG
jgi:hypothetical protein